VIRQDAEFRRFVESQLVWDRAMAQGIAEAARQRPGAVVVGLMGSGHVIHGWGVSHQLQQMGSKAPLALLPWDRDSDCASLVPGLADAVFGVAEPPCGHRLPAAARHQARARGGWCADRRGHRRIDRRTHGAAQG